MVKLITVVFLITAILSCENKKENYVLLEGKVFNNECNSLFLFKSTDLRDQSSIKIPVNKDRTFSYKLVNPSLERYELIFDKDYFAGLMMPISFFPDNDNIKFKLYPKEQFSNNEISGSKLSMKIIDFEKNVLETFEAKFEPYQKQLDSLYKINEQDSKFAKEVIKKTNQIGEEHFNTRFEFIENDKTLVGYSMLMQFIKSMNYLSEVRKNQIFKLQPIYKSIFPNHIYTELSDNLLLANKTIVVGKKYIDFSAKNNNNKIVQISNEISKNKVTLIDLWAPWCGSCRKKGRETIPLYNKYKNSGFGVIGVVGGIKSKNEYVKANASENYPWENLYELNDENKIWLKYNINNSGGGTFLIDSEGIILAVSPSTMEVEEKLANLLD